MAATPAPHEPSDQRQTFIHFAQTSDHLYLAPTFYTKADHVTCSEERPQHILLTHIGGKSSVNGHSETRLRPNSVASQGNEEDELVSIPFGHSIASSQSELFDDDLDEDSNDTRSCSSSSGCSSSSNSMVGSVNRHLTLGNGNLTQRTSTITTSSQNGAISSVSQYKDLTPKQVKRRLDWDSAPETPLVAKHTMTAVNGKPVSVRTFKLSNAMKQSLVAAGCSNAVAVAAVHATSGSPVGSNTHQAPTTIAIVNGPSSKSTTPTVHTIVTSNHSSLVNGTPPGAECLPSSQVIFKTPLAPKLSSNSVSPNQPSQTTQVFIVNKSGSLEQSAAVVNGKSSNVRLTPILASSVSVSEPSKMTNGVKRARVNNSVKLNGVSPDPVPAINLVSRTPKTNGARVRHDSLDNNSLDSPCFLSSPFNGNNDMSSTGLYSSSSYPCSPSSCSSSEFSTGRRSSGRTRYETSLGQLTRKFIQMLQESNEGSLNLNDASDVLQVQKRRIYDITNVLEGVGLLHKTSKNSIQWRGGVLDYCAGRASSEQIDQSSHYRNRAPPPLSLLFGEQADRKGSIEEELIELENDENRLDNLIELANDNLNHIKAHAKSSLYASYMDLRQVPEFKDQTVIGIRPPMDTTLEVPDPSESLQIRLKNTRGEMIEVYLCPRMSEEEEQSKYASGCNQDQTGNIQSASPLAKKLKTEIKCEPTETTSHPISMEPNSSPHSDMPLVNSESGYHSGFGTRSMVSGHSEPSKLVNATPNLGSMSQTTMASQHMFSPHSSALDLDRSFTSSVLDDFDHLNKSEPLSNGHDHFSSYAHSAFLSQDDGFTSSMRTPNTFMGESHEEQFSLKSSIEASGHAQPSHYHHQALNHHTSIFSSPLALIPLDPPVTDDDYNFTLSDHEGIAELFDDDFSLAL